MTSQGSPLDGLKGLRPENIPPPRTIGIGLLVLLGLLLVWSSVFMVQTEEVGVVLTFGKYSHEADPGLRIKMPWPLQTVVKVPVQRQLNVEFGFRTATPGVRSQYAQRSYIDESLMLTGDLNVAVIEWTTQFRIDDAKKYLFNVRNLYDPAEAGRGDTFRDMNEAVMRAVIGDRSVSEVLTVGRQEIASEVERRLQELCDQYETGITVEQIVLQDVNPPDQVRPAFNEVNQAQQEKERMINEARAQYNTVIPRAGGEAQQTIQQAEGYATDRVNRARGDAELFKSLLAAYRRSPEVTRRRIYLETMQAIYPNVRQKIILDQALQGILPLLPLTGGR
ncbi:MAG: FtsH protease activity modulator HflK [Gemmatimonadetes bacterium]|nr:FtsH protease activity modulator HflK [Gemmatimonadota bacterium]